MTITVECTPVISGKSLFVKILVHRLLITGQTYISSFNTHKNNKFKLNKVLRSGILFCV